MKQNTYGHTIIVLCIKNVTYLLGTLAFEYFHQLVVPCSEKCKYNCKLNKYKPFSQQIQSKYKLVGNQFKGDTITDMFAIRFAKK